MQYCHKWRILLTQMSLYTGIGISPVRRMENVRIYDNSLLHSPRWPPVIHSNDISEEVMAAMYRSHVSARNNKFLPNACNVELPF